MCVILYVSANLRNLNNSSTFNENLNKVTLYTIQLKDYTDKFIKSEHSNDLYEMESDQQTQYIYNTIGILSESNTLLSEFDKVQEYELAALINQNIILISDYETSLYILVQNIILKGNKNYGYVNTYYTNEEKLEIFLRNYPDFLNRLKNISRFGHFYFNSNSPEYADMFLKEGEKLKSDILSVNELSGSSEEVTKAYDLLSDYINDFKQIVNLDRINGIRTGTGLYLSLTEISNELVINTSELSRKLNYYLEIRSKKFETGIVLLIVFSSLIFILSLILLYQIFIRRSNLIHKKVSEILSSGKIEKKNFFNDIFQTSYNHLDTLRNDMLIKEKLVNELVMGNYSKEYHPMNDEDKIGKALKNLQLKLSEEEIRNNEENENRKIKDKQKEGVAKFGRILRRNIGNIDLLSYELISELVRFMNADIGGLYISDKQGENNVLILMASYAFDEKKIIQKVIPFGEGMVGTCAVDKSIFYFDNLKDDYINIVSGFGYSKPESLLICPIFVGNDVYGVIELAAVRKFNKNDIDFIETLTEDIAYTLSYLFSQKNKNLQA